MTTITFQVNLTSVHKYTDKPPFDVQTSSTAFANTRSTFFPDNILANRKLKHGDSFTVTGLNALYLKNNYTTGDYKFLDITSEGV